MVKDKLQQNKRLKEFKKSVTNRFNIYNSLFLSLPYADMENVSMLVPLLFDQCEKGLANGEKPQEIMQDFFANFTDLKDERERIDFMILFCLD